MARGIVALILLIVASVPVILLAGEASTLPPAPSVPPAPPAPEPQAVIEIQTWAGYHDGKPRTLKVADVLAVTPHFAVKPRPDGSKERIEGSRIETRDGAWYATNHCSDLIARLTAAGWMAPPPVPPRPAPPATTTLPSRVAKSPVPLPRAAPKDQPPLPPGMIELRPWPGIRGGQQSRVRVQDILSVDEYIGYESRPQQPRRRITGCKVVTTKGIVYTAEPAAQLLARLKEMGRNAPPPQPR